MRRAAVLTAAGAVLLLQAAPARAVPAPAVLGPVLGSATSCPPLERTRAFAQFLDPLMYALVPGGSFEPGGPGWALDDARIADENEPFRVNAPGDTHSVAVAPGGSVVSPAMCGRFDTTTLRFFVRSAGSRREQLGAGLRVEALTQTAGGALMALRLGRAAPGRRWAPTRPFALALNLLVPVGDVAPLAFRFTAVGGASWLVDDVYVDPFFRG